MDGDGDQRQASKSYRVSDGRPDQSLDPLTWLAADIFDAPHAGLVLADDNRRWVEAAYSAPGFRLL